jgi:hypothetical protein
MIILQHSAAMFEPPSIQVNFSLTEALTYSIQVPSMILLLDHIFLEACQSMP